MRPDSRLSTSTAPYRCSAGLVSSSEAGVRFVSEIGKGCVKWLTSTLLTYIRKRRSAMIRVEPIALPSDFGDEDGVLVFRNDRLIAVLSCLGEIHGQLKGRWYIEAHFAPQQAGGLPDTFSSLEEAK